MSEECLSDQMAMLGRTVASLDRERVLHAAASASAMKSPAATGWAMKAVCEPTIDLMVAPMRSTVKRSASGGMALSWSDTRYQDG
jgi:hypothetical protein